MPAVTDLLLSMKGLDLSQSRYVLGGLQNKALIGLFENLGLGPGTQ